MEGKKMATPEKKYRSKSEERAYPPLPPSLELKLLKPLKELPAPPKFTLEEMMAIRSKTLILEDDLFKSLHSQSVDLEPAKKIFERLATRAWNPEWHYKNEENTFVSFQKKYTRYMLSRYEQYLLKLKELV